MPVELKFDAVDVQAIFAGEDGLTGPAASQAFARFASAQIAEVDQLNTSSAGRRVPYETFVDGRASDNLKSVKPNGIIVAEWQLGSDVVAWIYAALREQAPNLSGEYRKSITIFADNSAVSGPGETAAAEEVAIMATVPYARKLEGIAGAKYMSKQAPEGVFKAVYAIARQRFGNIAKIEYKMRAVAGNSAISGWAAGRAAKTARSKGSAKANRQFERDSRNPAIIVRFS